MPDLTADDSAAPLRVPVAMLVWNTLLHEARVIHEARSLASHGHEVTIHALHAPGLTQRREQAADGLCYHRLGRIPGRRQLEGKSNRRPLPLLATAVVQLGMIMRIVRLRPKVVHAHDVNTLAAGWLAARLSGAALVYDAHEISTSRENYRHLRSVVAWLERHLARRADAMITTGRLRAKFFARAYGVPRPLVLQNRPMASQPVRSNRIRERLGIDRQRPIVLYQGSLQTGRGLELIVEAAGDLPEADFVFIGSGRLLGYLKGKVAAAALGDRVHFIPAVPIVELPGYTASADIGLQVIENTCFNHYTTDSNKLFEYLAAGLPMIVSDLPEMASIVRRYQTGRLIVSGDAMALVCAIRELISDEAVRETCRRNALEAAKELSWEAQEPALIGLYCRLVNPEESN